ncbi:hypothetical protein [Nocardioides alkalitolerans]|uniref:hypothetical protein n=1 Tax=Nocardioides alkalitolerans TaxID=281714 RepID=UPI00040CC175|nr:hypothetical protein [Nocardioides alkalitolerans]
MRRRRPAEPSGLWVPPHPMPRSTHPWDGARPPALVRFRRSGPWNQLAVIFLGVIALAGVALVGVVAWVFLTFRHDPLELVDDDRILTAVAEPCRELTSVADEVGPLSADPAEQAEQVRRLVAAGRPVPAAVLELPEDWLAGDQPAVGWALDWTDVLDEAERYADALAAGEPAVFSMPASEDDYTVAYRMEVAVDGCRVPAALETLDPDPPRSAAVADFANKVHLVLDLEGEDW